MCNRCETGVKQALGFVLRSTVAPPSRIRQRCLSCWANLASADKFSHLVKTCRICWQNLSSAYKWSHLLTNDLISEELSHPLKNSWYLLKNSLIRWGHLSSAKELYHLLITAGAKQVRNSCETGFDSRVCSLLQQWLRHCCSIFFLTVAVSFFSLLQHQFFSLLQHQFSHCCSINSLIPAAFIRYSFSIHLLIDTLLLLQQSYLQHGSRCSLIAAASRFSLLQHHVSHYCSIHSFVHCCSAHQPMPAFIPSIDSLVRSLLQHRFPHSCSIFFSHCCSIKLIIAAAFIRSLLQHAHWCITRYSCSIHFLMPPARLLIAAAASRFSLLQHSFIHSFIAAALINQCLHSFPASILSFAHCCSTDSLIPAASFSLIAVVLSWSLLQHSFAHCCSMLIGALLVTPAAFIFWCLQHVRSLLQQHHFSHCWSIHSFIAAAFICSLTHYSLLLHHSFSDASSIDSCSHYCSIH